MSLRIATLLLLAFPSMLVAADSKIGDHVYITNAAVGQVKGELIPNELIPFPALITDVDGDLVWLERCWVPKSEVMSEDDALDYYSEHIRQQPTEVAPLYRRGIIFEETDEPAEAIADFTIAIRLAP
ncbi:MAG TPA: tetratricopeptide repeat protein, partial [Schlesneria sp.]